jgi:hypothetical protein
VRCAPYQKMMGITHVEIRAYALEGDRSIKIRAEFSRMTKTLGVGSFGQDN